VLGVPRGPRGRRERRCSAGATAGRRSGCPRASRERPGSLGRARYQRRALAGNRSRPVGRSVAAARWCGMPRTASGDGGLLVVLERAAPDRAPPRTHHEPEHRQQPHHGDEEAEEQRPTGRRDLVEPEHGDDEADELGGRQRDEGAGQPSPQQIPAAGGGSGADAAGVAGPWRLGRARVAGWVGQAQDVTSGSASARAPGSGTARCGGREMARYGSGARVGVREPSGPGQGPRTRPSWGRPKAPAERRGSSVSSPPGSPEVGTSG
jgi:hypothetical protein